jgi:hypothetical protein
MVSSGMLRRVALVRTDVSEERSSSFMRVTRNTFLRSVRRLLVTVSVVSSSPIRVTLMKEAPGSSETSVLARTTRHNITEGTILHSHRRENLKSYTILKLVLHCRSLECNRRSGQPPRRVNWIAHREHIVTYTTDVCVV